MTVTPTGGSGSVNNYGTNLDTSTSIQMQFAALQLALAQSNKEKASQYIEDITANQEKAKECAKMISLARAQQNLVKDGGSNLMDSTMVKYYKDNGLSYDTKGGPTDYRHDKNEWEYNIKSLTIYQETLGTNTQQMMVYVQDFMGQYNSYLTGANSCIQQANQTLAAIARGQ